MPGYKKHLMGGFFSFTFLVLLLRITHPTFCTLLEWLSCSLVGSLFPDIDVKSKGQNWFYSLLFLIFVCLFMCKSYFLLSTLALLSLLPLLVRHRGLFHKLWFIAVLSAGFLLWVAIQVPSYLNIIMFDVLFFFCGAVSHLWLDLGVRRMIRW